MEENSVSNDKEKSPWHSVDFLKKKNISQWDPSYVKIAKLVLSTT